jgi:hypothetical protein
MYHLRFGLLFHLHRFEDHVYTTTTTQCSLTHSIHFDGSCSSSIARSQIAIVATVSGSCQRLYCWENADSRRAADKFGVRLAAVDLEGACLKALGLESTLCRIEAGQLEVKRMGRKTTRPRTCYGPNLSR